MLNRSWNQNYNSICRVRLFGLSALLRQLPQHLPDEVCNCSPVDTLFYNFTQLSGKNHNEASNVAAPAMPLRTLTGWKQPTCLQSALHYTCYDGFGCLNFWKMEHPGGHVFVRISHDKKMMTPEPNHFSFDRNGPVFKPQCLSISACMFARSMCVQILL